MDENDAQAERLLDRINCLSRANAEFRAAGVSSRVARMLAYHLKISSLRELRSIPWEDQQDRPGLRSMLQTTRGCGPMTAWAIRTLHAGR